MRPLSKATRPSWVLTAAFFLGVLSPCWAQTDIPPSDLQEQAALLASDDAKAREQALRRLISAGEAALPHLRSTIRSVDRWPPRTPVWVRASLYPSARPWPTPALFERFGSRAAEWEFLRRYPDVPRSRRGRFRLGTRPINPRVLATMAVANLKIDASVRSRELLPLLADRDVEVRFAASYGLGAAPAAIPELLSQLDDPRRAAGAAHALSLLGDAARTAVTALIESMTGEVRPRHRDAISLLALLPETARAIPLLVDRLGHGDAEVRRRASDVLEVLGRHAIPALRTALTKPNVERQCRALTIFARTAEWSAEDEKTIAKLAEAKAGDIVGECARQAMKVRAERTPALTIARTRAILKEMMRNSITIERPNGSPMNRRRLQTVFKGSYDFHSCVIAHWSLLVMARLDGDKALEKQLLAKLDRDVLAKEAANLASLPTKTWMIFPYDQGWFLMLLAELANHEGPHGPFVAETRRAIEDRILTFLEATPLPDGKPPRPRGGSRTPPTTKWTFLGHYRSWLMGYLLVQLSNPIDERSKARLHALRKSKIEPNRKALSGHETKRSFDFLWLPAILAIIDRTTLDGDWGEPAAYDPGPLPELPYKVRFSRVHLLGQELTRIWPLAFDGGQGNQAALQKYAARLHEYTEHREIFTGSFSGIAHWIPQFTWIGIWLSLAGGD